MEIKRTINNKCFIFCVGIVMLSFVLGYFLLVSIDKIENITIEQLLFSVYTVFTQFGQMIFPFVVIYTINIDYREKNILFYKSMNIKPAFFFINKLIAMTVWFSIGIIISISFVCLFYRDFSYFITSFLYYENTTLYTILISSLFAFVFKNMLGAFGANLIIWIGSIVTYTIFPKCKYIAYYDASNVLYADFEKYFQTSNQAYLHIGESILHNLSVLLLIILLIKIFSKRWYKNGI